MILRSSENVSMVYPSDVVSEYTTLPLTGLKESGLVILVKVMSILFPAGIFDTANFLM